MDDNLVKLTLAARTSAIFKKTALTWSDSAARDIARFVDVDARALNEVHVGRSRSQRALRHHGAWRQERSRRRVQV